MNILLSQIIIKKKYLIVNNVCMYKKKFSELIKDYTIKYI